MRTQFVLLVLAFSVFGCRADDVADEPAPEQPALAVSPELDAVIQDTIVVEGLPEPVQLKRYDDPGIPFTTYYPHQDFAPASFASGEGLRVRFVMGTATGHADLPFIGFFFPSEEITEDELKALIRHQSQMEDWRITSRADGRQPGDPPWSIQRIDYQVRPRHEWLSGTIFVGRHDGRIFAVEKQYPPEFGVGFLPRANVVLEHCEFRE